MFKKAFLISGAAAIVLTFMSGSSVFAADHREAPLINFDPGADINDIYVFTSPTNSANTVFVMTVNPFSARGVGGSYRFDPQVLYTFLVDTDADTDAEHIIDIDFTGPAATRTVNARLDGETIASGAETLPNVRVDTAPAPNVIQGSGGVLLFAGPRDDPFFFDAAGFNRFLGGGNFTGVDSFSGFNISAIVLEIPTSTIGDGAQNLEIWGATYRRRYTVRKPTTAGIELNRGDFEQIERMGVPAVSTALIPGGRKDEYNRATPADDAAGVFAGDIVAALQSLGTNQEFIGILAGVAIPDTLKVDTTQPTVFPNGRGLADDVIDTILTLVLNGTPAGDNVPANEQPFLTNFPYLAPPFQPQSAP